MGGGRERLNLGPLGIDECPQSRGTSCWTEEWGRQCEGFPGALLVSWTLHSLQLRGFLGEFLALWLLHREAGCKSECMQGACPPLFFCSNTC